MKADPSRLLARMRRKAMSSPCRYLVVAAGIDRRGTVIDIATNTRRLPTRGLHAEEKVLGRTPRTLRLVVVARFNKTGHMLAIDPCYHCGKLAEKRGVKIESW